jgi:putative membrane protein
MVALTPADLSAIEAAVEAAEARTSAEIVVTIAEMSDDYRLFTVPYAAVIGFAVFGGLALVMPDLHVRMAFLITGGVTLAAAAALQWAPLRLLTVPRAAREAAAERLAREEFTALVARRTAAANGLLIFVALAEHHAEIVADAGLASRLPPDTWRRIMDDLIAALKAGRAVDGVRGAIAACGEAAAGVFPRAEADRDEIANAPRVMQPE